jgi:hypothetical protein
MQHFPAQPPLQKPVSIEVDGEPLGVVLPVAEGFRFLAVRLPVFPLEGQIFATIEAAQIAAAETISAALE